MIFTRKPIDWHLVVDSSKQILAVYEPHQGHIAKETAANLAELGGIQMITVQRKSRPRIGDTL